MAAAALAPVENTPPAAANGRPSPRQFPEPRVNGSRLPATLHYQYETAARARTQAAANDPQYGAAKGRALYEEYNPFGTTAYRAHNNSIDVSAKRYRYTGMERDEETGLAYHGARYYASWLGRWTAADPIGLAGGLNLFEYSRGNPIRLSDPSGRVPVVTQETHENRVDPGGTSGVAGFSTSGYDPEKDKSRELVPGTATTRRVTPDAPATFTGPKALQNTREAVRDELFIEATAQGLLGGKGRDFEYAAVIFSSEGPGGTEYSHTRAFAGEIAHVEFDPASLVQATNVTRVRQGRPTNAKVLELAHTHPSGIRARTQYRVEALSPQDVSVGRKGEEGDEPANLALVTPSGGYDVVGLSTGGQVKNVLPRTDANRLGVRPEFRPDIPDLPSAVRARIEHIVGERRSALQERRPEANRLQRRSIERKLERLDSVRERALERLDRAVTKGRL